MIKLENECVHCDWCMGCGRKKVPRFYCDNCEQEFEPDELYETEDGWQCADCILSRYEKIPYFEF
jgi:hypothetical protein